MRTPGFVADKTSGEFGEAQRSQKSTEGIFLASKRRSNL
jgi:hypothetical protein